MSTETTEDPGLLSASDRAYIKRLIRVRCEDCGKNWADYPSKACPGCEAYREHQR